jgi:hypothetical protein
VERIGHSVEGCDAEGHLVSARCRRIYRIPEPLPARRPSEVISTARVGRAFQIDAIGAIAVPAPLIEVTL